MISAANPPQAGLPESPDSEMELIERLRAIAWSDDVELTGTQRRLLEQAAHALSTARKETWEEAAKVADDFHWQLPLFADKQINEATDDAACAVCEQLAAHFRSRASNPKGDENG